MRFALPLRMARREVRRRPFRTLLVALLVAVPSFVFVLTQTASRTMRTTATEEFRNNFGMADLVLTVIPTTTQDLGEATKEDIFSDNHVIEEVRTVLGPKVSVERRVDTSAPMRVSNVRVSRADRSKIIRVLGHQPDDAILGSTIETLRGRPARSTDEIVITQALASAWQVDVGETLSLSLPRIDYSVVGVARIRRDWKADAVFVTSTSGLGLPEYGKTYLVRVPGGMTWTRFSSEHPELAAEMMGSVENSSSIESPSVWQIAQFVDGGPYPHYVTPATPWSSVLLILEFAVLAVIIAAAFATSARRQLVTVGQLGANGAPGSVVRMSLAFQGLWSGVVGLVISAALFAALLFQGHARAEQFVGRDLPAWRVPIGPLFLVVVVSLLAATVAAWLPARAATRTSVLQALAGRTILREVPRRLLPVGLGLFASGTGLDFLTALGSVADQDSQNTTIYMFSGALGGLLILAGVCCMGPVIVSFFGPLGARAGGVVRLTARSLARGRARSAAVVVGITAFAAMGLSASTAYITSNDPNATLESAQNVAAAWGVNCPYDPTLANSQTESPAPCTLTELSGVISSSMNDTLSGSRRAPIRWAMFTPSTYTAEAGNSQRIEVRDPGAVPIADEMMLESLGLSSRDRSDLDRVGFVWIADPAEFEDPARDRTVFNGKFDEKTRTIGVSLMTTSGKIDASAHVLRDRPRHSAMMALFVTEKKARSLGLAIENHGAIFVQDEDLREWQRVELQFLGALQNTDASAGTVSAAITIPSSNSTMDEGIVEALISGGVLLATLFIVTVGLALMAAEGKEERDVLVAIGASPRSMASLAALRAWLLTMCAMLLAVPVGLIPVSLILNAGRTGTAGSVEVPWRTIVLLFCVPFLAYAVTRVVTAITQRAKPVTMSTFAFD